MLKNATFSPAHRRHAETCLFPGFVLGSKKSSTYPRGYASGFFSPAALLGQTARLGATGEGGCNDDLFEHAANLGVAKKNKI
jgi:hypothetical protein